MIPPVNVDAEINGTATLNVYTDQPSGAQALVASFPITGAGTRKTVKCHSTELVKGCLSHLELVAGSAAITIHAIQVDTG